MWGWLRNHNGSIVLCLRRFSKRRPRRILAEFWGQGKRRSGLLLLCPERSEGTLPSQPDQCQGCSCALLCLTFSTLPLKFCISQFIFDNSIDYLFTNKLQFAILLMRRSNAQ